MRFLFFIPLFIGLACTMHGQDYYEGTSGLTGNELKLKLHQIINDHTVRSYDEFRDTILPDLDEDPNNSNNVIVFYKNTSVPKADFANGNDGWNREHTWPSSHGFSSSSDTAFTDAHNLRPSDATVNTSKSNKDFNDVEHIAANEQGEAPDTYTTSDFWEPRDEIKGDVARILFYMDVRYESDRLNLELVDRISFSNAPELGVLYTLIEWHEADPVDAAEMARHEGVFGYQGNRNPFIDHPEWVAEIWGSTSEALLTLNAPNLNPDFGIVELGSSLAQSYTLNAYNLTDDVSVKVDAPFSVSLDQMTWTDSIGYSNDDSGEQNLTVNVRFEPASADQMATGMIVHFTDGDTIKVDILGEEGSQEILSIAEARQLALGEVVNVTGIVLNPGNNSSNNKVIYDGTAGIVVRSFDADNESANLNQGDSVKVSGGLGDFSNLLQISQSPIVIEVLKENVALPEPQLLTLAEVSEEHESELIKVENVTFISTGEFQGGGAAGNFLINDGTDDLIFRLGSSNHPLVGTEIPAGVFTITGFVGQFAGDYQLSPRTAEDMVAKALAVADFQHLPDMIYPNPASQSFQFTNTKVENYSIMDLKGRIVKKGGYHENGIDIHDLSTGVYLVVLIQDDRAFYTRLMKE